MNDEDDSEVNYSRRAMLEATLVLVWMVALCDLATPRAAATGARHSPTLRYLHIASWRPTTPVERWSWSSKLRAGEPLTGYKHHLMVDVVLLHVTLQTATAERLDGKD
jgi:hypothetical protein